jgi:hypothetical protein
VPVVIFKFDRYLSQYFVITDNQFVKNNTKRHPSNHCTRLFSLFAISPASSLWPLLLCKSSLMQPFTAKPPPA